MKTLKPSYVPAEELASSLIHGAGTLAAIAGLVFLALRSRGAFGGQPADAAGTVAAILFAATMVAMFLASTLYHAIRHIRVKQVLRVFDHAAIFLLIAGTYTPFCLTALRGAWGWTLFGFEWGMAAAGIVIHALRIAALRKFEIAAYILMGWAIVAGWFPLVRSVSFLTLALLVAGGLFYTFGVFWYRKKNIPGTHAVWHLFVVAGAACHWASVWVMLG